MSSSQHVPPIKSTNHNTNRHFCAEEGLLATGDDAGVVKLWDCRAPPTRAASTIKKNEDFISDLLSYEVGGCGFWGMGGWVGGWGGVFVAGVDSSCMYVCAGWDRCAD